MTAISLESDGPEYPARALIPPGALAGDARETFLVFPLAFENQLLGVVAFSYSDGINAYAAFRNEIATALKSIRLREELVQKSLLHERSVQERLAATKRMEALGVLAGGVAHDLNNALGPLIALPDVILAQLSEMQGDEQSLRDLRADVETMKVASLRAAQTIKDLLTLGRQGRTAKDNVDINRVIRLCLGQHLAPVRRGGDARHHALRPDPHPAGRPRLRITARARGRQPDSQRGRGHRRRR